MLDADLLWSAPFALLLASIAVFPLLARHWWEKNYPLVALGLGALVAFRYSVLLGEPDALTHTAAEYGSFIALIGALYVVAGGILIRVKGEAKPIENTIFLLVGAVVANFLGTTGASMVLVRPWLKMNTHRLKAFHVVFFIFLVSNVGGCLTPIGDPPLFLGYLRGVPFFWVLENLLPHWGLGVGLLLAIFFALDAADHSKASARVKKLEEAPETWRFEGGQNILFLLAILGSVFISDPPFLREAVMIGAAALSYRTTLKKIHHANEFGMGPIREVAILFAGIFLTMIPALAWIGTHAAKLGLTEPGQYYWSTGMLSAVLDNAPTYLNFLSAAVGLFHPEAAAAHGVARHVVLDLVQTHPAHLAAISVGAVFFGAMTYIGNGPNFLVKSIAEQSKVTMPSFFGYVTRYSVPFLLPVLAIVWLVFFRG